MGQRGFQVQSAVYNQNAGFFMREEDPACVFGREVVMRGIKRMTVGLLACLITFTAVAGFSPARVNGDSVKRPAVDRHDYIKNWFWSSPVKSYIIRLDDGGYMLFYVNVQLGITEDGYQVEYYDSSFRFLKSKHIKTELGIFGTFYSDSTGYYVFTGKENPKESANVECYRLTKYDKDWNRIGSCGFYDCNTVYPLDCGGANITSSGKYMVIGTNHTMYKSSDGYNHEANVTALVDTSEMKLLDIQCAKKNYAGYCSHSFNHLVKIEDNHIIGVSHGDAFPREIGLWYYGADITTGRFDNPMPTSYTVLKIGGSYEEDHNYTGAALGGFEISNSSYLIAGNSIDQKKFSSEVDEDYDDTACGRNIFVSVMDKSTGQTSVKWLTNDATEKSGYYNPFLVKVNDNSFAVLWSAVNKESTVYYAFIDGKGNIQGSVKSAPGYLTDCQPVLSGKNIVWFANETTNIYQWKYEDFEFRTFFYSINTSDKSFSSKTLYFLDIEETKHGKASLSTKYAAAGDEVTVNVTPDEGYELSFILVNGKRITGNKFTMPADGVMVTVNFKKEGSPDLEDKVDIGDYSYQVTNSDTDGAGTVMLTGVSDQVTAVVVPTVIDINGFTYKVTKIAARAFFGNTNIKTVTIGANVVLVDTNAFFGCSNLVKVSGGAGLKAIGQTAFARCPKLSSFVITSKVLNKIGPQAFYKDSKLKTISIKKTTKLTKGGVKKSLKGSKVKTVKVKKSKIWKYSKYFKKSNSGRRVRVKK